MTPARHLGLAGLRFALAAVFIAAGLFKLWQAPETFADGIASFRLLPHWATNPVALGLPPFEILAGGALLVTRTRRLGAFCVLVMSLAFLFALALALARGIAVECGCFGGGASWLPLSGPQQIWFDLVRDAALVIGALVLYRHDTLVRTT